MEFHDKKIAKHVAETLNTTRIGMSIMLYFISTNSCIHTEAQFLVLCSLDICQVMPLTL